MDDLIDLTDCEVSPAVSSVRQPQHPRGAPTPREAYDGLWRPITPDSSASCRPSEIEDPSDFNLSPDPALATPNAPLVSIASRVGGSAIRASHSPTLAHAVPLPSSPLMTTLKTPANSDTASSKTQSTLSAAATPFRASGKSQVTQPKTPISSSPSVYSSSSSIQVSTLPYFTPTPRSTITITSPAPALSSTASQASSLVTSPLSMTVMQDRDGAHTPSTASSSSLRLREEQSDDQDEGKATPTSDVLNDGPSHLNHLTESFRSISLSLNPASDAREAATSQTMSLSAHPVPLSRAPTVLSYTKSAEGMLTPDHTGESFKSTSTGDHCDPSHTALHQERDKTIIGEILEVCHQPSQGDVYHMEEAYAALRESIDSFQETLVGNMSRLRTGRQREEIDSASISISKEEHLDDARQSAYAAALRGTREKLKQGKARIKDQQAEIDRLDHLLTNAEDSARASAVELRVRQAERMKLEEQIQLSDSRAREAVGRLLRLEEDQAVLKQLHEGAKDVQFVAILLEADGRMFDKICPEPYETGQNLATSIIEKLSNLYACLKAAEAPQVLVHLFLDVAETAQDLVKVGRILKPNDLTEHLQGFQQALEIGSVSDVRGLHGPSMSVKAHMRLYSALPQCSMVVLGAGWNRPYLDLVQEWQEDDRVDKLYSIRSTQKYEKDPFVSLGPDKLLYLDCLFATDVKKWKAMLKAADRSATNANHLLPTTPSDLSNRSNATVTDPETPSSRTETGSVADDQLARFTVPPWEVHKAPQPRPPTTSGSLLDQLESMRSSSRKSSTGSDRTVGPTRSLAIQIEEGGSIGGSPPSSDSDDPSVHLPHSARKYVRRPIPFADNDNDNASDISSFTMSSRSSVPAPAARAVKRAGRQPAPSGSNMTPLGSRYASTAASTFRRIPWAERMDKDLIDMRSESGRPGGNDSVHGFRWHHGPKEMRARRLTSEYKYLRLLDPSPCHRYYLEGRCDSSLCHYGHEYELGTSHIHMLRVLAKEMNCKRVKGQCEQIESRCIYSHRCPYGSRCTYGQACWFTDDEGRHIE